MASEVKVQRSSTLSNEKRLVCAKEGIIVGSRSERGSREGNEGKEVLRLQERKEERTLFPIPD
jgi:hypothetical protein